MDRRSKTRATLDVMFSRNGDVIYRLATLFIRVFRAAVVRPPLLAGCLLEILVKVLWGHLFELEERMFSGVPPAGILMKHCDQPMLSA